MFVHFRKCLGLELIAEVNEAVVESILSTPPSGGVGKSGGNEPETPEPEDDDDDELPPNQGQLILERWLRALLIFLFVLYCLAIKGLERCIARPLLFEGDIYHHRNTSHHHSSVPVAPSFLAIAN